jgi:hypothetical protein
MGAVIGKGMKGREREKERKRGVCKKNRLRKRENTN